MKTMIKYFLLFVLSAISYGSVAQGKINDGNYGSSIANREFYKTISFGEKIDFGTINTSVKWTITNSKERIATTLSDKQISNYIFQEPGEYEVHFSETKKHDDECNHPMFSEKMIVRVSPVRLLFNFSKIEFSEKVERGRNYENLIITVPVTITTKENSIAKMSAPGMSISGIGVSLTAIPMINEVVIKDGIQLLKYKVTGTVNKETYLMFDFYDFNNQVQTYNLHQIIN
jgi:hypothetical protein